MDLQSPYEALPKVARAISMVGVGRQEGLLAATDKDDTAALTARYLCQLEATRHTSLLVPSSSSYMYLDASREVPAAQWIVLGVE